MTGFKVVPVRPVNRLSPRAAAALGPEVASSVTRALADDRPTGAKHVIVTGTREPWMPAMTTLRRWARRHAPGTASNYALQLKRWVEWAQEHGVDGVAPTIDDLFDYRDDRLAEGLSPISWNSAYPGVVSFLSDVGAVDRDATMRALRANAGQSIAIRYVQPSDAALIREVGLRGMRLDGRQDPDFWSPHAIRNGLYFNLLITTGLRRSEANALLLPELPTSSGPGHFADLHLSGVICKRNRPRRVEVPRLWLTRHRQYVMSEWPERVIEAQPALKRRQGGLLVVSDITAKHVTANGVKRKISTLTIDERARLVAIPKVMEAIGFEPPAPLTPLAVFPTTKNPGLRANSWNEIFASASRRVNRLRAEAGRMPVQAVRPHDLRHTFAIEKFKDFLDSDRDRHAELSDDTRLLLRRFHTPLLEVRDLLGHSDIATSIGYLRAAYRQDALRHTGLTSWADAILEMEIDHA